MPMSQSNGVIERSLALVGGAAVMVAAAAGGARLFSVAGLAVDDSMESLFDDRKESQASNR